MERRELLDLKHTAWSLVKATRMYCEKIIESQSVSLTDYNILRYCATSMEAVYGVIQRVEMDDVNKPSVSEVSTEELAADRDALIGVTELAISSFKTKPATEEGYREIKTALDVLGKVSRAVIESYDILLSGSPGLDDILANPFWSDRSTSS